MARPLRIEYEGAVYHVAARGNERSSIFFSKTDYTKFLQYLIDAKKKYNVVMHCYVLMSNHYHLILETPEANLSKAMHYINGSYTTYINVKRKRNGHLFQGRYKSILVDTDNYQKAFRASFKIEEVLEAVSSDCHVSRHDIIAYKSSKQKKIAIYVMKERTGATNIVSHVRG